MSDVFTKIRSYFPSPLPVGMTEFETWSNSLISLVGPLADENSIKFALCSQIMHLDPKKSSVPKQYFVQCLRKSAANQVASQVFQQIKQAQIEEQKRAEEEAKNTIIAADTAPSIAAQSVQA